MNFRLFACAALLSLWFAGCDDGAESSTDGHTSWLHPCATTAQCGSGLECICGICTKSCAVAADCSVGAVRATCAEGSALDRVCSPAPAKGGICVAECTSTSDCPSGTTCRQGLCSAQSLDGGADSSTNDQSTPATPDGAPKPDATDSSAPDGGRDASLETGGDIDGATSADTGSIVPNPDASTDDGATTPPNPEGGAPDGGDVVIPCPDDDLDGVCNAVDLCPGFDDHLDDDGDKRPNGCEPVLLFDINTVTQSSYPTAFAELDGNVYFGGYNGDIYDGHEVWSMGLAGGALSKVTDVTSPDTGGDIRFLTPVGDKLFFFTHSGSQAALWVMTPPGAPSQLASGSSWILQSVSAMNNRFVFLVENYSGNKNEVWVSDGTAAGTSLAHDYAPNIKMSLAGMGDLAYFGDYELGGESSVWRTDGTAPGTFRLSPAGTTFVGDRDGPRAFANLNGRAYFVLSQDVGAGPVNSVWSTDGTVAGTRQVFSSPQAGSFGAGVWATRTHLFMAGSSAGTGSLWTTTGEGVAPVLLDTLGPFSNANAPEGPIAPVGDIAYVSSKLGILRCDGSTPCELAYAATSAEEESMVILPGTTGAYFRAWGSGPRGLFRIDANGVTVLAPGGIDLQNLPQLPQTYFDTWGIVSGDHLFFPAATPDHGVEPWMSDGTVQGTHELIDLNATTLDSTPSSFSSARAGGPVVFSAARDGTTKEPWITSGTGVTTARLADTASVTPYKFSSPWLALDDYQFFVGAGASGPTVYRVDTSGQVLELPSDATSAPVAVPAYEATSDVLFSGASSLLRIPIANLLQSSPTLVGAAPIQSAKYSPRAVEWKGFTWLPGDELLRVSAASSVAEHIAGMQIFTLLVQGDALYFMGGTSLPFDVALYRLDDPSGVPVKITDTGTETRAFAFQDAVYFRANTGALYRTTASGFEPFAQVNVVDDPVVIGGMMFLLDYRSPSDWRLWVTDGTTAGTQMLSGRLQQYAMLVSYKGLLYFSAADDAHGTELWRSDGTPEGTFMEADLYPGPLGSEPTRFYAAPDALYFVANTPGHGVEPCILRR